MGRIKTRYPSIKDQIAAYGEPRKIKKASKKQKESSLQRDIISSLNKAGFGYFFRIRNGATFDRNAGVFRANTAEKGIPDIMGWKKPNGKMVLIEVKYLEFLDWTKGGRAKKLIFNTKLRDEQRSFLKAAHEHGCIAGVAFNLEDAINISYDDIDNYPRHPRTYCFMDKEWLEDYVAWYKIKKGILSEEIKDPVKREVLMANTSGKSEASDT